ncbi:MAG: hypothetical protein H7124_08325 [Phycisphaerales bacterium]|nr:hypothetical protein [Hyphomonadaceae bacterium]
MRRWIIAAAAVLAACTPPTSAPEGEPPQLEAPSLPMADAAGNRMEALTANASGQFCSGDSAWCVARDASNVRFIHNGAETPLLTFTEDSTPQIWPVIVRQDDESVLIGLTWSQTAMYSGGGAEVSRVTLYKITPGVRLVPEVLTAPVSGAISTRACFDEDDVRARREACLDEYNFTGALALDTANSSGPARFVFTTLATSYPGVRSRSSDSTEQAPLQQSDLQIVRDETCSYRRVLTFNGEGYDYDTAPPECADYLEP